MLQCPNTPPTLLQHSTNTPPTLSRFKLLQRSINALMLLQGSNAAPTLQRSNVPPTLQRSQNGPALPRSKNPLALQGCDYIVATLKSATQLDSLTLRIGMM